MASKKEDDIVRMENKILFPVIRTKLVAEKTDEKINTEFACSRCNATFNVRSSLSFHFYGEHIYEKPRREDIPLYLGGGEEYWM